MFKKVDFYYFSGTGNSKQIAIWFSNLVKSNGGECNIVNIDNFNLKNIQHIDPEVTIFIISPVHGFNYPKIMLDFIKTFPKGTNRVVLCNTRAGMKVGKYITPGLTGVAFYLAGYYLKKRGYKIVGHIPFDMPSNWISLHPSITKIGKRYIFDKNLDKVESYFDILLKKGKLFLSKKEIIQDILISPISLLYYFIGRFFLAKSLYGSDNCNGCGLCVKQCPVDAIKLKNGKPYWSFSCESCMRCITICPKEGIEVGHGYFLSTFILSSLISTPIYQFITNYFNFWGLSFLIFNTIFFIFVALFYRFQHLLLKNISITKFIKLFSLTNYKFWGKNSGLRKK